MIAPGISTVTSKNMAVTIPLSTNGHPTDTNPAAIAGKQ